MMLGSSCSPCCDQSCNLATIQSVRIQIDSIDISPQIDPGSVSVFDDVVAGAATGRLFQFDPDCPSYFPLSPKPHPLGGYITKEDVKQSIASQLLLKTSRRRFPAFENGTILELARVPNTTTLWQGFYQFLQDGFVVPTRAEVSFFATSPSFPTLCQLGSVRVSAVVTGIYSDRWTSPEISDEDLQFNCNCLSGGSAVPLVDCDSQPRTFALADGFPEFFPEDGSSQDLPMASCWISPPGEIATANGYLYAKVKNNSNCPAGSDPYLMIGQVNTGSANSFAGSTAFSPTGRVCHVDVTESSVVHHNTSSAGTYSISFPNTTSAHADARAGFRLIDRSLLEGFPFRAGHTGSGQFVMQDWCDGEEQKTCAVRDPGTTYNFPGEWGTGVGSIGDVNLEVAKSQCCAPERVNVVFAGKVIVRW